MHTASIKIKAIAIRAVPYNESDLIVTLVGVECGKITATAKGCLKPKAKLRYAAEPMNFGDYVLSGNNGRYVITECSQIDSFCEVTKDIERYYAASLVLEVLQKLSQESQPDLFVIAIETLSELAYGSRDSDCIVTDFLLRVLDKNGSGLDFAHCSVCGCEIDGAAFFKDGDGIVCEHCRGMNGAIPVDAITRLYIIGANRDIPRTLKVKANILLSEFVYIMLGVRIGTHYFTEQI